MSQHLCVSGSSARSMSLVSCLSIHVYLRILCEIHAAGSIAQQPYVSQDPLQDPCLRFMSQHLCISRILCKIHVSGYMSQHPFISQDPLQDPCLRIHVSDSCLSVHQYGSSARSMSPDSCLSIFVFQVSLQDPCLRIHVSASTNMDPLQDPCLRIHVSASLYLRVLCKIHVFGFMSQHLRITGSSARSMCPIHVLAFMSQHPFISQDPLQDPCLRIHVSASTNMDPLQDPRLWVHVSASLYLRPLCKIHVSGSVYKHP